MDTLTALTPKTVEITSKYEGMGKKNAVIEGREGKRASASKVGVTPAQVKRLVLMGADSREIGAEGEAFVCLGQTVLRKWNDESVRLSKVEVVGKVIMMGREVNGLASVMTKSAKLKAEVAGAGVDRDVGGGSCGRDVGGGGGRWESKNGVDDGSERGRDVVEEHGGSSKGWRRWRPTLRWRRREQRCQMILEVG